MLLLSCQFGSFWRYQKLFHTTVQTPGMWTLFWVIANAQNVFHQPSRTVNIFLKIWKALFCGKFSHVFSRATFHSLASFKKASCVAPQNDICRGFKFEESGSQLFRLNHLRTVRLQALLSDTCCVRRALCISLNLPLRPVAVGCSLQ